MGRARNNTASSCLPPSPSPLRQSPQGPRHGGLGAAPQSGLPAALISTGGEGGETDSSRQERSPLQPRRSAITGRSRRVIYGSSQNSSCLQLPDCTGPDRTGNPFVADRELCAPLQLLSFHVLPPPPMPFAHQRERTAH